MGVRRTAVCVVFVLFLTPLVFAEEDYAEIFMIRNGRDWYVETTSNGLVNFAFKTRPEEKGEPLSREQAVETARGFLEENSDCLGLSNFVYVYDELNEGEYFSYWIIDFNGDVVTELIPPHTYFRTFMTRDGQVYAIGDIDFYNIENIALIQGDTIQQNEAIELAQRSIESGSSPVDIKLVKDVKINDTDYSSVWDIKFNDPEGEVLIDAKTGKVLSIKRTKSRLGILSKLLSNPFVMIAFSVVVIGIIFVMFFFIKRIKELREGELEVNRLLLKTKK